VTQSSHECSSFAVLIGFVVFQIYGGIRIVQMRKIK